MPASPCRMMSSRLRSSPPPTSAGDSLNSIVICVRFSRNRFPERRKNGTPSQRAARDISLSAAKVGVRVIVSPAHLRRIIGVLGDNLSQYEERFGKIDDGAPPAEPRALFNLN